MRRLLLVFLLLSVLVVIESITITSFKTSTVTVTSTVTTKEVCGQLVNVTGACRRRRDFEFDKPDILTFDQDVEDSVDAIFDSVGRLQFVPTKTLMLEVTPLSTLSGSDTTTPSTTRTVQSSLSPWVYGRPQNDQQIAQQQRIFFNAFNAFFRQTLVVYTTFITETKTAVKTNVVTFFVLRCTPSPFPFNVCSAKR